MGAESIVDIDDYIFSGIRHNACCHVEDQMTIESKIHEICSAHPWTARWFRMGHVIIQSESRTWATTTPQEDRCPSDVVALGCTGQSTDGTVHWVGWDLDVGAHGVVSYETLPRAIFAARRLCRFLGDHREIRLSKSGKGVHVRQLKEFATLSDTTQYAHDCAKKASIHADRTPLSRQAFWLWTADPADRAFELIEEVVHEIQDAQGQG